MVSLCKMCECTRTHGYKRSCCDNRCDDSLLAKRTATARPTFRRCSGIETKGRQNCFSKDGRGHLTGHNTPRSHLYWMGLSGSPLCRRFGAKDEISAHILCECEALASLRHAYLGSFFLDPEDIKRISLGAIWNFRKATRHLWIDMGHKGPVK
jgi:hypothetical protein